MNNNLCQYWKCPLAFLHCFVLIEIAKVLLTVCWSDYKITMMNYCISLVENHTYQINKFYYEISYCF